MTPDEIYRQILAKAREKAPNPGDSFIVREVWPEDIDRTRAMASLDASGEFKLYRKIVPGVQGGAPYWAERMAVAPRKSDDVETGPAHGALGDPTPGRAGVPPVPHETKPAPISPSRLPTPDPVGRPGLRMEFQTPAKAETPSKPEPRAEPTPERPPPVSSPPRDHPSPAGPYVYVALTAPMAAALKKLVDGGWHGRTIDDAAERVLASALEEMTEASA